MMVIFAQNNRSALFYIISSCWFAWKNVIEIRHMMLCCFQFVLFINMDLFILKSNSFATFIVITLWHQISLKHDNIHDALHLTNRLNLYLCIPESDEVQNRIIHSKRQIRQIMRRDDTIHVTSNLVLRGNFWWPRAKSMIPLSYRFITISSIYHMIDWEAYNWLEC